MTRRPRILVIENSRQVTGALKSIYAMASDLGNDFEFTFILPSGSAATSWIKSHSKIEVIELPMIEINKSWRVILYLPMLVLNTFRLRRIIRTRKIDIVHSNDLYNMLGPMLKFFGVKFKYLCHVRFLPGGFPPWLFRFWVNRQLAAADQVIAVSDVLKDQLPGDPKVIRIYNQLPIDPKVIRIYDRMLIPLQNGTTTTRNGNTILYLSNIIPGKGHDRIIEAFAGVHKKFPAWKLKIVGSDMNLEKNRLYRDHLKSMAVTLGVADAIEWNDFVDDVATEYRSADIFANFSSSESFSMTCLEAQYYGCCVVATNSGGPAEILTDGVSGILVPLRDNTAMRNALEKLMGDSQLREAMGREGARIVREKFGVANTSMMLRRVYVVTFASIW
jgi:glycosyltransferase involved in cell wall biosynthesis